MTGTPPAAPPPADAPPPAGPAATAPTATVPAAAGVLETLRATPLTARFLLIGVFVNQLGAFLQAFLVLYLVHRGFSATQAGIALGAYGLGAVAGVLLGGGFSDRLGPRRTIVAGMCGSALLTVAIIAVPSIAAICVVVAGVGALSQAYRPASAALLTELIPATRQVMVFAMYRLGLNLGAIGGPLIAAALIEVSWSLLFWVDGLTAFAYAMIALLLLPRDRDRTAGIDDATPAPIGYGVVLRDRRYLLFLVAMLVNALVYVQYIAVLPLAVTDAGLPTLAYSALISLNGAIVICLELLVTSRVQRWPARRAVLLGFTLLGGGLSLYSVPGGLAVFVIGTVVWSLGEVVGGPTMFAYPAMVAPPATRGRYLGAAQAMFGVGNALGPVLGVALWAAVGSAAWLACGAGALLCIVAAVAGMRADRPAPEPEPLTDDLQEAQCESTSATSPS